MSTLIKSRELTVPFVDLPEGILLEDLAAYTNNLSFIKINNNPWPGFTHHVNASFSIAHSGKCIFLKYLVKEDFLVAEATTNGKISDDSCVELFIAFEEEENYYNLEFNCLGWCKIGYGKEREKRVILDPDLVESISSKTKISSSVIDSSKAFSWEITLAIPLSIFCFSEIKSFKGLKAKGNFYKCGDGLPHPHYLTWSPIETAQPDFHRAEYFGSLSFS